MNRRELLKRAGIAGGVGVVGLGALGVYLETRDDERPRNGTVTDRGPGPGPETPDAPETPRDVPEGTPRQADEFGTVVDAVEAGADPEGNEPINLFLDEHAADDTLLSFPPGTYLLRPATLAGHSNFGIAAAGDERPTFVAPEGLCLGPNPYLQIEQVDDFLLAGVDFDFRRQGAGGILHTIVDGDALIRDVSTVGNCRGQIAVLRVDVLDDDGTAVIENFTAENHGDNETLTGVFVGSQHSGELTFRNCELRGFTDNGLYASAPGSDGGRDGVINAEGGTFENNNISNIRLGSTGSTARDVSIRIDSNPSVSAVNLRGIRFRWKHDQFVKNCDIEITADAGDSFGAVVFHSENAGAYVKDTRIKVDRDGVPAVHAFARPQETEHAPVLENLRITGSAAGGYAATLDGRNGAVFRNCRIEQTGANRGGIRLSNGQGYRITDSVIDVTRAPVRLHSATVRIRNCRLVTPRGERTVRDGVFKNQVVGPA